MRKCVVASPYNETRFEVVEANSKGYVLRRLRTKELHRFSFRYEDNMFITVIDGKDCDRFDLDKGFDEDAEINNYDSAIDHLCSWMLYPASGIPGDTLGRRNLFAMSICRIEMKSGFTLTKDERSFLWNYYFDEHEGIKADWKQYNYLKLLITDACGYDK